MNHGHYPPETTVLDKDNLPGVEGALTTPTEKDVVINFNFADINVFE
jgi:hypothetical protein